MTTSPAELWLPVQDYEGVYEVSNLGRIRRIKAAQGTKPGKILKGRPNKEGYLRVTLQVDNIPEDRLIHTAVLEAFVGPKPPGQETRHLNSDRADNRLDNLMWGTPLENSNDKEERGTLLRGEEHPSSKLTDAEVQQIRSCSSPQWVTAQAFGISQQHVSDIVNHRRRKIA